MKLKVYNAENSATIRRNKPAIRLNIKSGVISFSSGSIRLMGLKPGTGVVIANDEDSPRDWFIHITPDPQAYKIKCSNSKRGVLFFNSTILVREIFRTIGISGANSAGFLISGEPVITQGLQYWLLITAKPFGIR